MTAATMARGGLLGVYRPAAPLFVSGSGAWLTDDAGRRHLDLTSGLGVNALGHGHPAVLRALDEAGRTGLLHVSNLFRTAPAGALADWLVARSFADAVFFCNSGAEANEAALKFSRRWARAAGGPAKAEIVSLRGAFHGRTLGALSVTDRPEWREPFEPLLPGVRFADAGDLQALERLVRPDRTAAVLVEPIQGEGGVRVLDTQTLERIRSICDAAGALLIADEVQVGLGRTGRLWAHEWAGIEPDIMTVAKPLAGGLPAGATLLSDRVAAAVRPGDHASTFGGGPLVGTVALAVVRAIGEPDFLAGVVDRGRRVAGRLATLAGRHEVMAVRGRGLIWGLETAEPAAGVVARALDLGLLLCAAGPHVVRLLPPLNIPIEDLDHGLDLLEEAL